MLKLVILMLGLMLALSGCDYVETELNLEQIALSDSDINYNSSPELRNEFLLESNHSYYVKKSWNEFNIGFESISNPGYPRRGFVERIEHTVSAYRSANDAVKAFALLEDKPWFYGCVFADYSAPVYDTEVVFRTMEAFGVTMPDMPASTGRTAIIGDKTSVWIDFDGCYSITFVKGRVLVSVYVDPFPGGTDNEFIDLQVRAIAVKLARIVAERIP